MQSEEPSSELEGLIHDDEELQLVARPEKMAKALAPIVQGFIGAVIVSVIVAALVYGTIESVILAGVVFVLVMGLLLFVSPVLTMLFDDTEYAATDKRLITYSGKFGRDLDSVPVEKVQDAEFDVSTAESFFDVGTVTIDTDRGVESMAFQYVSDPAGFATEINQVAQGSSTAEAEAETAD